MMQNHRGVVLAHINAASLTPVPKAKFTTKILAANRLAPSTVHVIGFRELYRAQQCFQM